MPRIFGQSSCGDFALFGANHSSNAPCAPLSPLTPARRFVPCPVKGIFDARNAMQIGADWQYKIPHQNCSPSCPSMLCLAMYSLSSPHCIRNRPTGSFGGNSGFENRKCFGFHSKVMICFPYTRLTWLTKTDFILEPATSCTPDHNYNPHLL